MSKALPIARGRKFQQVLEGARAIFLRDGFEGASVDDIAREAGVSKATLYSYFPDKRVMFIEVFRSELAREAGAAFAVAAGSFDEEPGEGTIAVTLAETDDVREQLTQAGAEIAVAYLNTSTVQG